MKPGLLNGTKQKTREQSWGICGGGKSVGLNYGDVIFVTGWVK